MDYRLWTLAQSLDNKTVHMSDTTRRKFISNSGKLALASGLTTIAINDKPSIAKNMFIHHVYFWLNNPGSKEDLQSLLKGLQKLSKVKSIKTFHIGVPADTNRDVIERSYAVSWMLIFENKEEQDKYQVDPVHLKFIEECKHLWSKVIVYDSVDAPAV
jgi:hypothetical protein